MLYTQFYNRHQIGVAMPIFSYLAIPDNGAKETLCTELAALQYCQVIPADNHDVVVLVTETPDESTEEALQESLKKIQSLQSLSLAFGYDE
jgi:nitrate reductase NapAB chaperone NapD